MLDLALNLLQRLYQNAKFFYNFLADSEELGHLKENNEDTEDLFSMKVEEIKTFIHNVRKNMGQIQHYQSLIGAQKSKVEFSST